MNISWGSTNVSKNDIATIAREGRRGENILEDRDFNITSKVWMI